MLPVFFATDQLHHPPCSAEIQPMSQQDASATCPYRGLVLGKLVYALLQNAPDAVIYRVEVRTIGCMATCH